MSNELLKLPQKLRCEILEGAESQLGIKPYLLEKDLILPTANVVVYSPLRTFWEKATLIHVECHRGRIQ